MMWRRVVGAMAGSETSEDGREVTELGLKGGGILIIVALGAAWRRVRYSFLVTGKNEAGIDLCRDGLMPA